MANITKKDNGNQPTQRTQQSAMSRWDPLQMIGDLLSFDPFRFLRTQGVQPLAWNPGFEVVEKEDGYVFKADLPGVKESDLDISLEGNRLEISGKREVEHEEGDEKSRYHTWERSFGSFARAFALPDNADLDHIRSELKDGVLTLVVPKKAGASQQKRKIQIGQGPNTGKA